jgi:hypothetical protein
MFFLVDDTYMKVRRRGFDVVAVWSLAEMLLLLAAGKWSPRYASSVRCATVVVVGAFVSVFICAILIAVFVIISSGAIHRSKLCGQLVSRP